MLITPTGFFDILVKTLLARLVLGLVARYILKIEFAVALALYSAESVSYDVLITLKVLLKLTCTLSPTSIVGTV